ncbi:MAG: hypothetical protein ACRDKA_11345 [Actinomycetota bacterium]
MRIFGGLLGLALALFLWAVTATVLGVAVFGGPVAALLTFLGSPGLGVWLAIALFALFMATLFAYVLGAVATVVLMAAPATAAPLPTDPLESFAGGFLTGLTAGVNFGLWALVPFGLPIGIVVGTICFLVVFPPVSRSLGFQSVLGWSSWIMPYSWLATGVGLLLFVINLPLALGSLGPGAVRLDVLTGTIETTGGIVGITGFVGGGFNLGNFSFLSPGPGVGLAIQTPFGTTGLSAHETGHTLSVPGFGGMFHWINAVDENVPPLRRFRAAYGELIAESHFPAPLPIRHVRIWS